jgi:SAM-dependent methyltransferase
MSTPDLERIRAFWQEHPIGDSDVGPQPTAYDYFRAFDNLREGLDVEPYAFSNLVHDYEGSAGKVVLDYGCGNGYVLGQYARHGASVYGVDVTDAAIELTKARFVLLGLEGTFVRNDGTTIPFEDGFFDIACSMGVLHHIPDPGPVVAELHRVLKPGGKLIVMLYNRDSFRYRVTFRMRGRGTMQERVNRNDGAGNPYGTVYSQEETRRLLAAFQDHRFLVNKLSFGEVALWTPPLERALVRTVPRRALDRVARRWGWNLYCVARKPTPPGSSTRAAD